MVLCIGEILADLIGKNLIDKYDIEMFAGGAPFNVACAIKKLGGKVGFVGRVGDDIVGRFLTDFAQRRNFELLSLQKDCAFNTTLAFVSLDNLGERSFCFMRKSTADYKIDTTEIDSLIDKANIVHIGSLALSEQEGRKSFDYMVSLARKKNKHISFDVNYREDIFSSPTEAAKISLQAIDKADIIKLSESELNLFINQGSRDYKEVLSKIAGDKKFVCLTLGSQGSAYYYKGIYGEISSIKVDCIDTTGAGDAFYGAVLNGLDEHNIMDKSCSDGLKNLIDKIIYNANLSGAHATTYKGAIEL